METDTDILIIGAGAAGFAAARELSRAGHKVLILEARDRIGGRIHTHFDAWPIELGAEFVHGKAPETLQNVERAVRSCTDSQLFVANSLPVASRKKVLEMRFVASNKKVLEMVCEK